MKTIIYLHSSKETLYYKGEELGLKGSVLDNFIYACYEVKIELDINEKTGESKIVKIDNRKVED